MRSNRGDTKVRGGRCAPWQRRIFTAVHGGLTPEQIFAAAQEGPTPGQVCSAAQGGPTPEQMDIPKGTAACGDHMLEHTLTFN